MTESFHDDVFVIPASFAQQRLWFFDQLEADSALYNIPVLYRIEGMLDVSMLERALQAIVARQETLRTTFAKEDEQPVQVIHPVMEIPLRVLDLSLLGEAEKEAEWKRFLHAEAHAPFDLKRGPLFRTHLLKLGEQEYALLVNFHHIISDGWSVGVFVRELVAFYEAEAAGKAVDLPELPLQYADFSLWQQEWLQGEVLDEQMAYWKRQLGGALPILELPSDRPRPVQQTFVGTSWKQALPGEVSEAIRGLCQREGVTLYMALLAAFQTLLARLTGLQDILVGSPISGRNQEEVEGLIGFFVNTLVLRTDLSGEPTFRELLGRVRDTALGAFSAQDVPFEKLVEELQPVRSTSHSPLFQVIFAVNQDAEKAIRCADLTLQPVLIEHETAKFDLTLGIDDTDAGLVCNWNWNTDLYDEAMIRRWHAYLVAVLAGVVADPSQSIARLPLVSEQESHHVLQGLQAEKGVFLERMGLRELFALKNGQLSASHAVYLLDAHWQSVPMGAVGALYLAGVEDVLGGKMDVAAQGEAFLPNPFASGDSEHGRVLYKTGKRGYFRADGRLTLLGEAEHPATGRKKRKRPNLSTPYVTPAKMAEEVLTDIWEEALCLESVGVQDNFFDLGGTIWLAPQVMARLQASLEVSLPLTCLFERPTIAELSRLAEERMLVHLQAMV